MSFQDAGLPSLSKEALAAPSSGSAPLRFINQACLSVCTPPVEKEKMISFSLFFWKDEEERSLTAAGVSLPPPKLSFFSINCRHHLLLSHFFWWLGRATFRACYYETKYLRWDRGTCSFFLLFSKHPSSHLCPRIERCLKRPIKYKKEFFLVFVNCIH